MTTAEATLIPQEESDHIRDFEPRLLANYRPDADQTLVEFRDGTSSLFDEIVRLSKVEGHPVRNDREALTAVASGGTLPSAVVGEAVELEVMNAFTTERTSSRWTFKGKVENFKTAFRPIVDPFRSPTEHARGGTADHAEVRVEVAEGVAVGRFSRQLVIDEMDLGDEAKMLLPAAGALGGSFDDLVENLSYSVLHANGDMDDGSPLFVSGTNYETTRPLSAGHLTEDLAAFKGQQSDPEHAVYLGAMPSVLLVGSDQFSLAHEILDEHPNLGLTVVESPRINGGVWDEATKSVLPGIPGSWFLIDPRRAVERCFLFGEEKPQINRWFKRGEDGRWITGWSVNLNVAVKPIDRRCIWRRDA